MNILIAYYTNSDAEKVAKRLESLFVQEKHSVKFDAIISKKNEEDHKAQEKLGNNLKIKNFIGSAKKFDLIIVGTPFFYLLPIPAVKVFLRELKDCKEKKFILYATGIGLPGSSIKKMQSIVSMQGGKVIASETFTSIFDFDEKKLKEVDAFFEKEIKPNLKKV